MSADPVFLISEGAGGTGSQTFLLSGSTSTGSLGVLGKLVKVVCAVLVVAAANHPTGGGYSADAASSAQASGAPALVDPRTRETLIRAAGLNPAGHARRAIAAEILLVSQAFSLTMKQVSVALDVSRLAVYRWVAGTAVPRDKHRARLTILSRLAARFRQSGGWSVGLALHTPIDGGATLMELLCKDPLPEGQINLVLSSLANASARLQRAPSLEDELVRLGMLAKQTGGSQQNKQGA